MTINNNQSYLNNVNSLNNSALEKIGAGLAINKASDDASGLAIADQLKVEKNSLSQSIGNLNSGIAMSNLAQKGISSQKELLENIKTETIKAMSDTTSLEGREAIADQINKYIEQYNSIAQTTNYNGTNLLKTSGIPSEDELSVVGEDSIISMSKADTTTISDTLEGLMADFTTNKSSRESLLDAIEEGLTTLSNQASEFGSVSNSLESMARNYISARTNTANAESTIRDLNLSEGIASFNKTNLLSQIGHLVQSQSNAVQSRTISLLS